jgi:hypothetical protein
MGKQPAQLPWLPDGKHSGASLPIRSFTRRNAASGIIIRIEVDYYFIYDINKNSNPFPT